MSSSSSAFSRNSMNSKRSTSRSPASKSPRCNFSKPGSAHPAPAAGEREWNGGHSERQTHFFPVRFAVCFPVRFAVRFAQNPYVFWGDRRRVRSGASGCILRYRCVCSGYTSPHPSHSVRNLLPMVMSLASRAARSTLDCFSSFKYGFRAFNSCMELL